MPRAGNTGGHQAAHQAPTAAAAGAQKKHPHTPNGTERKTENVTTPDRSTRIKLTRFKPGHEWETELQVAQAFRRPPRLFKEDKPFYPWLPKPEPIVKLSP